MIKKIRFDDQWYILAAASPADERRRVLKFNEMFALFDRFGDIQPIGLGEEGIYFADTCFLSHLELLIAGVRPMFLNSTVKEDNGLFVIELMNPDIYSEGKNAIPKGILHLYRAKLLYNDACYEHVRITNFGLEPVETRLSLLYGADFKDIFEVRGYHRSQRGHDLTPIMKENEVLLGYRGLDDAERRTRIHFEPVPQKLTADRADFDIRLAPKEEAHFYVAIGCEQGKGAPAQLTNYFDAFSRTNVEMQPRLQKRCKIISSNPLFNNWVDRSTADLVMLTSSLPEGDYPYAGLPWYSTTFGRDGILTAWEYLLVDPGLAKGVLAFLAATQATELDPVRDAEPGKILHEAREGEGCVVYLRRTECGLAHQGWNDSHDSIFHADGRMADAPIALCEVQGYVYDAKLQAAQLARLLGDGDLAHMLEQAAETLKKKFNDVFWCEDLGMYALALDGKKQPCVVGSSNAGHALWSGIATEEKAARVAEKLLSEEFFCGWGVRTIRQSEVRYNPMAYHNGSVWPHDNALIAAGMARYGLTASAMKIFDGLRDVSLYMDQHRIPELFCGFEKRPDEGPTLYPVACSPQAWAAASVFYLLQACLGMSFDLARREIRFKNPQLPAFLDSVELQDLVIGDAIVDLQLQRFPNNVGINIVSKVGNVNVVNVA